jgi:hypothetical protein
MNRPRHIEKYLPPKISGDFNRLYKR